MSDHYLFHLTFDVRADAPPQLQAALAKLADGGVPTEDEINDLPGMVQMYLRGAGVPGDGIYCFHANGPRSKFIDGQMVEIGWEPHEGSHRLRMAQTFHDDEFWNGGMYFIYWLYQFVAYDGPIGTVQQTNGNDPVAILTKRGDTVVETSTAYNPGDADAPISVARTQVYDLLEMMAGLAVFADGYSYD